MNEQPSRTPLVSIVLPTYNRADILTHSIDSILNQTYRNLELIVVNDHSSDATEEVVKSIHDDRLVYIKNQSNLKLPRSLNKGFSISKGDFLTWTSDDNMYTEDAIEVMVEHMQTNDCEFVFTDYYHFFDLDINTGKAIDGHHVNLPDKLELQRTNQVGGCFLYSRNVFAAIGDYDADLFLVEDYDYFIRISKSFGMCHIDKPLYYFRRHDRSLFVSRFCEVKAADLLVRYKNRLLSKHEALESTVNMILANNKMIRNSFVRNGFFSVEKFSYRAGKVYRKIISLYLSRFLDKKLTAILDAYDSKAITFKEGRDKLNDLLQRIINLEFVRQATQHTT